MTDLSIKEAFDIYMKHRDVIVQLWQFFSGGTLAVLGYTVGSEKATRGKAEVSAIILGYLVFSIGNAAAVVSSQMELREMARGLKLLMSKSSLNETYAVAPIHPALFAVFYAVVVSAVCYAIYRTYIARAATAPNPGV